MKKIYIILSLSLSLVTFLSGQNKAAYLIWTGEADKDFFNEQNWRISTPDNLNQYQNFASSTLKNANNRKAFTSQLLKDNDIPAEGSVDPGVKIMHNLYIKDANIEIDQALNFDIKSNEMIIHASTVKINSNINLGKIIVDLVSTIQIMNFKLLTNYKSTVQVNDAYSWVMFEKDSPDDVRSFLNDLMVVNNQSSSQPRIRSYYDRGTVVDMGSILDEQLTVYDENSLKGRSTAIDLKINYKGNKIPNGFNNKIKSFVLKRGNMACFAAKDNGTGKSKIYIASEKDLVINELPLALQGTISFIRVTPWNWVNKKGFALQKELGGLRTNLDAGWYYDWGFRSGSLPNYEYAPMTWGHSSTSIAAINTINSKDTITHLLGFNEPDDCNGQSGKFGNLCQPSVAVDYAQYLMNTGLRIGSPAPREEGPTKWLKEFNEIAKERDVRFDFVAVHWYDWSGHFSSNPKGSPEAAFNRFKSYLANVYALYGLPIWITEFNANPNRDNTQHVEFLKLALPFLESLPYVERYAYFQPSPIAPATVGPANFFLNNALTNIGTIYKEQVSTPSIPSATYESPSNLEGMNQEILEIPGTDFEAEDAKMIGTPTTVLCDRSSNGKHIAVGAVTTNALVFDSIIMPTSGNYRMSISYLTATARKVKLFVNGEEIGVLNMPKTGEWCFNNGAPIDFKVSIKLKGGKNSVEFRPIGIDAPSIDKINLVKEEISFEAENAQLEGEVNIVSCGKASNGKGLNMNTSPLNSAKFKVTATTAGLYLLDIAYVANTQLVGGIIVNGKLVKNELFDISGDLCDIGGVPRVNTIEVSLVAGSNTIELKPLGAEMPFIDKIAILSNNLMLTSLKEEVLDEQSFAVKIYPNPGVSTEYISLLVESNELSNFEAKIYDVLGNLVDYNENIEPNRVVSLGEKLTSGVYFVVVRDGFNQTTKKLILK